jgi:DNA-damage-inducible protein D
METDWQLSELATYLLMINCNPLNPLVAKAQLIFMMKDRV